MIDQTAKPAKTARKPVANPDVIHRTSNPRLFRIPADQIISAVKGLPEDQASAIKWLAEYCRANNLGKPQMATLLKKPNGQFYSSDSITSTLTGGRIRRGENIQPLVEAIQELRDLEEARAKLVTSGFIHTRLSSEIWLRCDKARLRQRIGWIFGDSQIGKTEALKEYARRNNHGRTIYIEVPDGGSKSSVLRSLATIMGIPTGLSVDGLSERLTASFDHTMLLILDEGHRMLKGKTGLKTMDWVRRLWNKSQCGIIIAGTNEGRKLLLEGPNAKEFEQLWRRRIQPLQLPNVPPLDDLNLFAEAYHLPPADEEPISVKVKVTNSYGKSKTVTHTQSPLDLQTEVVTKEGLGVWIMILQDASDIANDLDRDITWGAVIKAYCLAQADAEMIQ